MKNIHLYRPVGLKELDLIAKSNWKEFPPRVEEQPIFYPVLTYEYAELIIQNWNIKESIANYAGAITKFDMNAEYVQKFSAQIAGGPTLQELWVPADELIEFNKNIIGSIKIVGAFYGENYIGDKIEIKNNLSIEPSQLFIDPIKFVKNDEEYQQWLEKNSNGK